MQVAVTPSPFGNGAAGRPPPGWPLDVEPARKSAGLPRRVAKPLKAPGRRSSSSGRRRSGSSSSRGSCGKNRLLFFGFTLVGLRARFVILNASELDHHSQRRHVSTSAPDVFSAHVSSPPPPPSPPRRHLQKSKACQGS